MFEGTAITLKYQELEASMSCRLYSEPPSAPFNAQVSFKWQSSIFALEEIMELEERVRQLLTIVTVRETLGADPFEVFDLRPLKSYRAIVKVRERRPSLFRFVAEGEDLLEEVNPFEVFDLRPLRSRRVTVEVRERRPTPFQFIADGGRETE